jgi:hypothetical protein
MNRRSFIGTSFGAALAASTSALTPWALDEPHRLSNIGLELYTVRDAMKADFAGTLAKVAAVGYKEVEFAGYFDHPAKDIRALLDKNGLTSPA